MKRLFVALAVTSIALLSVPNAAVAQFGFRGGMNLSKFVGGDATDETETNPQLGVSIPLFNLGPVGVVPEVYYAQRGGQRQLDQTTIGGIVNPLANFSMNYIEVPLLLKLGLDLPGPLVAYLAGGPSFSWQLKCDVTFESAVVQASGEESDCQENQFATARTALDSSDKAIIGNAGLYLGVGSFGGVNLDFRMQRGLSGLADSDAEPEIKSQTMSLMLGYSLGIF